MRSAVTATTIAHISGTVPVKAKAKIFTPDHRPGPQSYMTLDIGDGAIHLTINALETADAIAEAMSWAAAQLRELQAAGEPETREWTSERPETTAVTA